MRILSIERHPFFELPYSSATGNGGVERKRFPLIRAKADQLPDGLDALLICSDLQGVIDSRIDGRHVPEQVGVALADSMYELCIAGELPPPERIGIALCGDLYTAPDLEKRGGCGDARPVWNAFANYFAWVVGVAGNHDAFGTSLSEHKAFSSQPGVHMLDGTTVNLGGVIFAGVGGIIGDANKPLRRSEKHFVRAVKDLLSQNPDVLLLHQGPDVPSHSLPGHEAVRGALHRAKISLVACGHVHWKTPLAELPGSIQVLNADSYGFLLETGA